MNTSLVFAYYYVNLFLYFIFKIYKIIYKIKQKINLNSKNYLLFYKKFTNPF